MGRVEKVNSIENTKTSKTKGKSAANYSQRFWPRLHTNKINLLQGLNRFWTAQ